eukprot:m.17378 g.17378  ORF g.17378 m.17378 type:complete len:56 (-) comp10665_c0_seq9:1849-2016(-)
MRLHTSLMLLVLSTTVQCKVVYPSIKVEDSNIVFRNAHNVEFQLSSSNTTIHEVC